MRDVVSLGDALTERGYTVYQTNGVEYVSGFGCTLESPTLEELRQLAVGALSIVDLTD
jgi:hypothetical protein